MGVAAKFGVSGYRVFIVNTQVTEISGNVRLGVRVSGENSTCSGLRDVRNITTTFGL